MNSKALDKVPHNRVVQKVGSHGIQALLALWIQLWLGGRNRSVVVEGCFFYFSVWRLVTSGVPQGLVLGPLLFIIYSINGDEKVQGMILK